MSGINYLIRFAYIGLILIGTSYHILANDIVCGQASKLFENCFTNRTKSASEFWKTHNIPFTVKDINERCILFNLGMKCFHDYTEKCIDSKHKRLIESEIEGAKQFYHMLCNDRKFKQDYLEHKECFRLVQNDWNRCTKTFVDALKEEFTHVEGSENVNLKYMHFCCARYNYETCVYSSANHKCKPKSAIYTKKIVELMSSEQQFRNCEKIQDKICENSTTRIRFSINIYVLIQFIYFVYH